MENLDITQSIKTIEQAVQEARRVPHGAYYYFILWGIILFLYYILNYLWQTFAKLVLDIKNNFHYKRKT